MEKIWKGRKRKISLLKRLDGEEKENEGVNKPSKKKPARNFKVTSVIK